MATTQQTALQQLYVAYFNRPADPAGLAFYDANLTAGRVTMAQISADFAKSAEYQTEYNQATFSGVVTQVYQNLFGHAPDATGLAFYVKALNDKTMTIDTMVTFIANGAQGTDKVAFDAKVAVAAAFTEALNTDAEKAAYNNADAQAEAKDILSDIDTAAEATAAIAAIDTHVAAVVKAGTPFTLVGGLEALESANEAVEEFLDGETAASFTAAVNEAQADIAALVTTGNYTTASAAVRAALLADQEEENAEQLENANEALEEANDAVAEEEGLGDAIAAATSARESAEAAEETLADATVDASATLGNVQTRNAGLTVTGTLAAGTLVIKDGADTVAEIEDGVLVLGEDIDAADYAGLAAFVTSGNAYLSAAADLADAQEAYMLAQLQVELLDLSAPLTAGTFTFTATTPANASNETYAEILDELSARTAAGTDAAFRAQIQSFINANTTTLADAVIKAQIGTLGIAEANVAAVTGLRGAIAAQAELTAAQGALATATTAYNTEASDFGTANPSVTVNANGTVDVTAGGADVVVLNADGELELASGVSAATYPGIVDFIAAGNARIEAQADVTAAALTGAETTLLANNAALVTALANATTASTSTTDAVRLEALGVEGSQEAIDDLADAIEALEEAQAAAAELKSLQDAVVAARAEFTANDYKVPVTLGATAFGTTGSDIFVADAATSSISNFGRSGDDVLYIGSGYTLNTGDFEDDGDDAALEVFFVQQGNNTIVTIETKAFGSNSADAEIKITLTGVDADDLSFENGIISI